MGIADIRAVLATALESIGTVSNVKMSYGRGGAEQRISFILTATKNKAKSTTSEETLVVPSKTPLLTGLQQAASVFAANYELEHAK